MDLTADSAPDVATEQPPPELLRPCPTCPFLAGGAQGQVLMTRTQTLKVLEHLINGGTFNCHSTAEIDAAGNLTADHASECPGAALLVQNLCEAHPELAALAERYGTVPDADRLARLRGRERVFSTLAELLAAALPDGPVRHRAYIGHGGSPLRPFDTE